MKVIITRIIIGFAMTIGAVLILLIAALNKNASLLVAGVIMTLSGLSFIWFSNLTRKLGKPR